MVSENTYLQIKFYDKPKRETYSLSVRDEKWFFSEIRKRVEKMLDNDFYRAIKAEEIVCIIPTLNESSTVDEVIRRAQRFVQRVIVVDGHSEDGTLEKACDAGAQVVFQDGKGKGMAIRTVFSKIECGIYVIIDGDATYDAIEIEKIVKPILDDEADMVIGSRLKGKMEEGAISKLNIIGNKLFNFLINVLFNGKISDSQSGFRAMNRKTVESLNLSSKGFEVETEITAKALKQGLRVKEVPITYTRRRGSASKLNSFKAGSRILKTIIMCSLQSRESDEVRADRQL